MNDCGCVWVDDYDAPAFYDRTLRTARKEHDCDECFRTIRPGERYEMVSGKWDGHLDRFKTCVDCLSVRGAFFCEGFGHGGIWEDLRNHLFDVDGVVKSSCLEPLTRAARAKVIDLIDDLWDDD